MPIVIQGSPYGALEILGTMSDADLVASSATQATYALGNIRYYFEGSGIAVAGDALVAGSIDRVRVTNESVVNGTPVVLTFLSLSTLGVAAADFQAALDAERSDSDAGALEALFGALSFDVRGSSDNDSFVSRTNDEGVALTLTAPNAWQLYGGIDSATGGTGSDLMYGGLDADRLDGGGGADTLFGGGGFDLLVGGGGEDRIEGQVGIDRLFGGAGNDVLFGGDSRDTLFGGAGADSLSGGFADDVLYSGSGVGTIFDRASGGVGNDSLFGGSGRDSLSGDAGDDLIEGGGAADRLFGGAGDDTIRGGDGVDSLSGGIGRDTIEGQGGNDRLSGGGQADLLLGGGSNDILAGDVGADVLRGEAGHDALFGGSEADRLFGGAGRDSLTGGGGADDFVFTGLADLGRGALRDVVTDFASGVDQIDLRALDLVDVGSGPFTGAGQVRFDAAASRLLIETTGDGVADFEIRLDGISALAPGDLLT